MLILLIVSLVIQTYYFLNKLDKNCLNNPNLTKQVNAEVVEKRESQESRSMQLGLKDSDSEMLLLDYAQLPWERAAVLEVGDFLSATLRSKKICTTELFSYQASLQRRGYKWQAYSISGEVVEIRKSINREDRQSFTSSIKQSLIDTLLRNFQMSDELAVLLAATIGEKQFLSSQVNDLFRKTGTNHLLVVSGYHISLVFMLSYALAAFLFRRVNFLLLRAPIILPASLVATGFACFYTCLVSGTQTAIRAFLVLFLSSFARSIGREVDSLRVLLIVAIFIIWIFPGAFLEPSFQLSFSAIFGIFLALKFLKQIENEFALSGLINFIVTSLIVSLFASFFTWPIIYFWFSSFVLLSPLYNALLTSIFSFLVIALGNAALLLYYFSPELFDELIILTLFLSAQIIKFLSFLS